MADPLSEQYEDLLEGSYDCVDRIILNAYFPKGIDGGGFSNNSSILTYELPEYTPAKLVSSPVSPWVFLGDSR